MSRAPLMVFTVLFLFSKIGIAQEIPIIQQGEDLHFESYGDDDGLSNAYVTSIIQDESGFMWFGTASGLNRFDGYDFKVFVPVEGDTNSLGERTIWEVIKSRDGFFWIGTQNGLARFDPATERFVNYLNDPANDNSLSNNYIKGLFEDKKGNIWIGTGNGLNRLKPESREFDRFFYTSPEGNSRVWGISEDHEGTLWFGAKDTLFAFNPNDESLISYELPTNPESRASNSNYIRVLHHDESGVIWVGTEANGLIGFDVASRSVIHQFRSGLSSVLPFSGDKVFAIEEDSGGNLWIGSSAGLHIINPERNDITHFKPDPFNANHSNFDQVWGIKEDRAGNVWVGTYQGGVKVYLRHRKLFKAYRFIPGKEYGIPGNSISSILETTDNRILMNIADAGVYEFEPSSQRFLEYPYQPENSLIYSLSLDSRNNIWYSTHDSGVWRVDEGRGTITQVIKQGDLCHGWVNLVYEDRNRTYWIGTQEGVCRYDPDTGIIEPVDLPVSDDLGASLNNLFVWSIFEDEAGHVWVASYDGLNRYNQETKEIQFYPSHSSILVALQDSKGQIWLGLNDGLGYFDQSEEVIKPFDLDDVSITTPISGMVEDASGNIWLSTIGLYVLDPGTREIKMFNREDGLATSFFNPAIIQASDKTLYVGSWKGLSTFKPDELFDNSLVPPVKITRFSLFNREVPVRNNRADTLEWVSPLENEISRVNSISLKHWQNDFSFEFAALDYTAPDNNQYRFQLEGYEDEWIETSSDRRFTHYTNLDAGNYVFRVKASNNDGIWNEEGASVQISIKRPWWTTWWAIVLYVVAFIASIYALWRNAIHRVRLHNQLEIEHIELEKIQELHDLQTRFFVNISHEIRTPLTLIIGPVTDAINGAFGELDEQLTEQLSIVRRNGSRLHKLINELLDLASFEAGGMQLQAQKGNLIPLAKATVLAFSSRAEKENILLQFHSELDEVEVYFDREKMEKVMTNLLSNAFKFTPNGGKIRVTVKKDIRDQQSKILIKVKDTGRGIGAKDLPHVFERFYQADTSSTRKFEGSGIGLALTKDFVELHGGTIEVESEEGFGTCFSIHLLEGRTHLQPEQLLDTDQENDSDVPLKNNETGELEEVYLSTSTANSESDKEHTVLVVEDNVDVRSYLKAHLEKNYHVLEAVDGVDGLAVALNQLPDLIISDVMMPRMDGNTLCQRLKNNPITSAIPVVLLTARVSEESRIDGLVAGADDYIFKPFNAKELLVRTENLIELRKRLFPHYGKLPARTFRVSRC